MNLVVSLFLFFSLIFAQADLQNDSLKTYEGKEIVVSDFFIAVPSSMKNGVFISDSLIAKIHPVSWGDILSSNGVYVSDGFMVGSVSSPKIAGADMARTVVLLDGISIFFPQLGEFNLNWLPFSFAHGTSILFTPYSSLYGSGGMGGAINILTRHPRISGAKTRLEISQGDYSTNYISGKLNYGLFDRLSAVLSGDKLRNNGTLDGQHYEAENLSARFDVDMGKNLNLSAIGISHLGKTNLPFWGMVSQQWDNHRIGRAEIEWNSATASSKITVQIERYKQEYIYDINLPSFANIHKADVLTLDARGGKNIGPITPIGFLQLRKYDISSTQSGNHIENSFASGLYAPIRLSFAEFFGSVRYDKDRTGNGGISSGVGMCKKVGNFTFSFAGGTGFRSPTPNDNYWNREGPYVQNVDTTGFAYDTVETDTSFAIDTVALTDTLWLVYKGNPEITSEHSVGATFSAKWEKGPFGVAITGWFTNYSNLIQWDYNLIDDTILWMPENVANANIAGTELQLDYHNEFFRASPTITFLSAKDNSGGTLRGRPQFFASVPIEGRYTAWNNKIHLKLRLEPTYTGGIDTTVNQGSDKASFLLGSRASIKYLSLEIFAIGENLLDKQWRTISGQPARRRNFRFGICWEFEN